MIELARPNVDLADSWWAMVDAFAGGTIHGSSLRPGDAVALRDRQVFAVWVDWLGEQGRDDVHLAAGRVPSSYRWILSDGAVVGTLALRHALNEGLLVRGGHLGYAVEPGSRRRGVATVAVRLALAMAANRGLKRVLITCESENTASARTIERVGGVFDGETDGSRRFWTPTRHATLTHPGADRHPMGGRRPQLL